MRYLADTSALSRMRKPVVNSVLEPLITQKRVALCNAVAFEIRFSARDAADLDAIDDALLGYPTVPIHDATFARALEIQTLAAGKGQLRSLSLVDLLVAAAAEAAGLTVLHYDADFDRIAKLTGQATQWVVKRGTAD